jgi:acetyl-CoA synthetase
MPYPFQITSKEEYDSQYEQSVNDPEGFWAAVAENFNWRKKWDTVLNWNFKEPKVEWFINGKLNITENCLDRHLPGKANDIAYMIEPNDPIKGGTTYTYQQLYDEVNAFAHVLNNMGVRKGDRVCIYMGMIPQLPIAMLACARIGAIHSVVFGGFSARSITDRLEDAQVEYIITADGGNRGNKIIPLKDIVDEAVVPCGFVKKIIVVNHTATPASMIKGRDVWWEDEMQKVKTAGLGKFEPVEMDAEDPLFILYTSGSTGKPKGVVHTCGGYMVYATYSFVNVFQYKLGNIYFCTADIGWITGHSYIVYGPLCAGATTVLFEGIPTYPDAGRFWEVVDKYKVNIFYTAPTAIRSLMSYGTEFVEKHKLDSLKVLGTVGEPINEEAWYWYHENIGKGNCPIVDTWFQTENGGILISNLAGITPAKPSFATLPLPGVQLVLVDEQGKILEGNGVSGILCIKHPWPSILRTTWGDHERCRLNYFATYPDMYFTGDGALRDKDGNYRITGRVDDVLNVSGHRIGTAEVENAINMHTGVIESAVVGYPHDIKGQGIYAYVIYDPQHTIDSETKGDILQTVSKLIGAYAKPDKVQFVTGLPKTRSGKIMRRILRKIAEGETENLGDTSTLLDPAVVEEIKNGKV